MQSFLTFLLPSSSWFRKVPILAQTNLSETKISSQNMKITYKQQGKYKTEELGMDSVTED